MTTKNHKCRVCGYNYHHCTSCDPTGIPWEVDDFCSGDCYYKWAEAEIERKKERIGELKGHLAWLGWSDEGVERAKAEIDRLQSRVAELELLTGDAGEGTG